MKIKSKTKARIIITWFILSIVAVLITSDSLDIPLFISMVSLILSVRSTIANAELIDENINMID